MARAGRRACALLNSWHSPGRDPPPVGAAATRWITDTAAYVAHYAAGTFDRCNETVGRMCPAGLRVCPKDASTVDLKSIHIRIQEVSFF